eukprot:symbB.v1.2.001154.t2/scaffold47.1/size388503/9
MQSTRPPSQGFRCNPKHATQLLLAANSRDVEKLLKTLQEQQLEVNGFHLAITLHHQPWRRALASAAGISSTVLQNTLMTSCVNALAWQKTLWLFHRTQKLGLRADALSADLVLKAVERNWTQACALFQQTRITESSSNYGVNSLLKSARLQWQEAMKVFYGVAKRETSPFSYNALLDGFKEAAEWRLALQCFVSMQTEGVELDFASFASTMSATIRPSEWKMAFGLMMKMKRSKGLYQPNRVCHNAALTACKAGKHWQLGMSLQMMQESIRPNVVSFNTLLGICETCGDWPRALELLNKMHERRLRSEISLSSAIGACGQGNAWQVAIELLKSMSGGDMSRTTALSACRKAKQWTAAIALADATMKDTVCSSAVVLALEDGSHWMEAVVLSTRTDTAGITLDVLGRAEQWEDAMALGASSMPKAVLAASSWKVALEWFYAGRETDDSNGRHLTECSAVCSAFGEATKWRHSLALFSILQVIDEVVVSSVISASAKVKQWEVAMKLLMNLPNEPDFARDAALYNAAFEGLTSGPWPWAIWLLEEMEKMRLADTTSYNLVTEACVNCGQWLRAQCFLSQLANDVIETLCTEQERTETAQRHASAWGARPSSGTPALPDDPMAPFLHPASRPLVQVPLEFSSLRHWCEIIGNNLLAEFWYMFKEARANFTGFGTAMGDEILLENAPSEGFSQCLLLLDRQPRIAASQRVLGVGKVAVKLRGGAAKSGLGFIGSFLAEFAAALELRKLQQKDMTAPMRAILEPKVDLPGDYAHRRINSALRYRLFHAPVLKDTCLANQHGHEIRGRLLDGSLGWQGESFSG